MLQKDMGVGEVNQKMIPAEIYSKRGFVKRRFEVGISDEIHYARAI